MSNYYQREIDKALVGITPDNAEKESSRLSVKITGPNGTSRHLTTPVAMVQQIRELYGSAYGPGEDLRPIRRYYAMLLQTSSQIPNSGYLIYDEEGSLVGFAPSETRGPKALKDAAAALAYVGYDPKVERWDYADAEYVGNAIECVGPHVTVRVYLQGILTVPGKEYKAARQHDTQF